MKMPTVDEQIEWVKTRLAFQLRELEARGNPRGPEQDFMQAILISLMQARGTLANNLCPDHRDKQTGKPCLACTIETLTRINMEYRVALEPMLEQHHVAADWAPSKMTGAVMRQSVEEIRGLMDHRGQFTPDGKRIPPKWKVVPIEPTAAMVQASIDAYYDTNNGMGGVVKAAIAAAPEIP